mgnify:CR=1 FL=1
MSAAQIETELIMLQAQFDNKWDSKLKMLGDLK